MFRAWSTTVATPSKCSAPRARGPRAAREAAAPDAGVEARRGRPPRRRGEEDVDPLALGQRGVPPLVARDRASRSSPVAELGRVDEQRDHHQVALLARAAHEREVAFVKEPHGGHEADGGPRGVGERSRSSATVRTVFTPAPWSGEGPRASTSSSKSASRLGGRLGHGRALARDGGLVAAGDRAGERPLRARAAQFSTVVAPAAQAGARLVGLSRRRGQPLGGGLKGHQEVRGDRGRRVVGGAPESSITNGRIRRRLGQLAGGGSAWGVVPAMAHPAPGNRPAAARRRRSGAGGG